MARKPKKITILVNNTEVNAADLPEGIIYQPKVIPADPSRLSLMVEIIDVGRGPHGRLSLFGISFRLPATAKNGHISPARNHGR
jgi:hypothetical protein